MNQSGSMTHSGSMTQSGVDDSVSYKRPQYSKIVKNSINIKRLSFILLNSTGFDAEPYVGQISTTYLQDHLWRLPESNEYLHFIQKNEQQHVRPKHLTFESLSLTGTDLHQSESLLLDRSEIPDSHNVTLPVETLNHNIQSVCLLLEGFSAHAYALKGNYNVYLVQTLYPILEKVGSSNATIHSTAMNVLNDISR